MPGTRHQFYRPFLRARQPATSHLTLLTAIGAKVAPTAWPSAPSISEIPDSVRHQDPSSHDADQPTHRSGRPEGREGVRARRLHTVEAATMPSEDAAHPVPGRALLPADPVLRNPEQEVVAWACR
ncbi:hypothetical protein [Streptomyces leeuwenhoekii]|uniref:hypothetical protein n=1 Tax=Streptomyces leeuwenhoekii TaxID=1437453 RepID=UPI000D14898E|nr:hypothetical protein [Streptomyces leeuwenhoekii]